MRHAWVLWTCLCLVSTWERERDIDAARTLRTAPPTSNDGGAQDNTAGGAGEAGDGAATGHGVAPGGGAEDERAVHARISGTSSPPPSPCPAITSVAHATKSGTACSGTGTGYCTISCLSGYQISSGVYTGKVSCDHSEGCWTPAIPTCNAIASYCSTYGGPTNGYAQISCVGTVGATCQPGVLCSSGYALSPSSSNQLTCSTYTQNTGTWTNTNVCNKIDYCGQTSPAGVVCGNTPSLSIATCANFGASFYNCTCKPGAVCSSTLNALCQSCSDINECGVPNRCGPPPNSCTTPVFNAYFCTCTDGYYGGGTNTPCTACSAGCALCTGPGTSTRFCQSCAPGYYLDETGSNCINRPCLTGYATDINIIPLQCLGLLCQAPVSTVGMNVTGCQTQRYNATRPPVCNAFCLFGFNGTRSVAPSACTASAGGVTYGAIASLACIYIDYCGLGACGPLPNLCQQSVPGVYVCTCAAGYVFDSVHNTCYLNNTICGTLSVGANQVLNPVAPTVNCYGAPNSVCTYMCNDGYQSNTLDTTWRCSLVGGTYAWVGSPVVCNLDVNYCPAPRPVTNGGLSCGFALNQTCVYSCSPGYVTSSGNTVRTCMSGHQFSGSDQDFDCILDKCFCQPLVVGGTPVCENAALGSQCVLSCSQDAGYIALPSAVTCQAATNVSSSTLYGVWQPATATCLLDPGYCSFINYNFKQLINAYINYANCSYALGGLCEVRCQAGYAVKTTNALSALLQCKEDHNFVNGLTCSPIATYCNTPPNGLNSAVSASCDTSLDGVCTYRCNSGFYPYSVMNRTCQVDRFFDGGPPACVPTQTPSCPAPTIPNGYIVGPCTGGDKTVCKFACLPGSTCSTPYCNATCQGGAYQQMPYCKQNSQYCPPVNQVSHGDFNGDPSKGGSYMQQYGIKPYDGYYVYPVIATCVQPGVWDGVPMAIASEGWCKAPVVGDNQVVIGSSTAINATWYFSCATGYGSKTSTPAPWVCGDDQEFVGDTVKCSPISGFCPSLPAAITEAGCTGQIGTLCQFTCPFGQYVTSAPSAVCTVNGWSTSTRICAPQVGYCANFQLPNGLFSTPSTACSGCLGTNRTFTCNSGYTMTGYPQNTMNQTCSAARSSGGAWVPDAPVCQPIPGWCATPSPPALGSLGACSNGTGCTCKIACPLGYTPYPDQTTNPPTCSASDHVFVPPLPTCVPAPNYCKPLVDNGAVIPFACKFYLDQTCQYNCNDGYIPAIIGATGTCTAFNSTDGFYQPAMRCTPQPNFCQPPAAPFRGNLSAVDLTYLGHALVTCQTGFKGTQNLTCSNVGQEGYWQMTVRIGEIIQLTSYDPAIICTENTLFCPRPTDINYGTITSIDQRLGGIVNWTCAAGFTPAALSYRVCQPDATYSQPVVVCSGNTFCEAAPDPPNSMRSTDGNVVQTTVTYTCNPGYVLTDHSAASRFCAYINGVTRWTLSYGNTADAPTPVCGAVQYAFVNSNVSVLAGFALFPTPNITVSTPNGVFLPDYPISVALLDATTGASIPFKTSAVQQLTATNASRVLSFGGLVVESFAGAYRGVLRAHNVQNVSDFICTSAFELVPGPPSSIQFAQQTTGAAAGELFQRPPIVCVYDKYQNPVANVLNITLVALNVDRYEAVPILGVASNFTVRGCASFPTIRLRDGGSTRFAASINEPTPMSVNSLLFAISPPLCEPGTRYDVSSAYLGAPCVNCPAGQFTSACCQSACQTCNADTYSEDGWANCLPCPVGGVCSDGTLKTRPGYWRGDNSLFYPCLDDSACPGSGANAGTCDKGYVPESFLCSGCDRTTNPVFGRLGLAGCAQCPSTAVSVFLLVLFAVVIVAIVVYLVSSATADQEETSLVLKVGLNYLQMAGLCSSFIVQSRTLVGSMLTVASTSSVSINIFPLACLFDPTFYTTFTVYAFLPFACFMLPAIFYGVRYMYRRHCAGKELTHADRAALFRTHIDRTVVSINVLLFLIYPSVATSALQVFECRTYDVPRLVQDLTIQCYTGSHVGYMVAAGFTVLVWGAGIPLGGSILLWRRRTRLTEVNIRNRYGLLFAGYKPAVFWWEFFIMLRKSLVVVVIVFIDDAVAQAVCGVFLVNATLLLQLYYKPFEQKKINRLDSLCLLVITLTLLFSALYVLKTPSIELSVTIVLMAINIGTVVVLVVFLVRSIDTVKKALKTAGNKLGSMRHSTKNSSKHTSVPMTSIGPAEGEAVAVKLDLDSLDSMQSTQSVGGEENAAVKIDLRALAAAQTKQV